MWKYIERQEFRWVTWHGVRLVDVHVEVLDQILKDREATRVTSSMKGIRATEVGVGQGDLDPFPLLVHALCHLFIKQNRTTNNPTGQENNLVKIDHKKRPC
jgi:hypothetical protein